MIYNLKSYKAKIKVSTRSKHTAAGIYDALAPDLRILRASDSRSALSLKQTHVVFKIVTSDIASLRASVNSYLRLADASYKCLMV